MAAGPVPLFPEPELPWEPWDEDAPEPDEPPEDGGLDDDLWGAPLEAACWWEAMSPAEQAAYCTELDALPVCPDPDKALFAAGARDLGLPAGVSVFSAQEAGDSMGPGRILAELSEQAFEYGLDELSDDALIGLVRASRRLAAWQDGVELAAIARLDARRLAAAARPGWSRVSEHVADELAMALVLTGRSADHLLGLARGLTRLPMVITALLEGQVDRARAEIFAEELSALVDAAARTIADALIGRAGSMTTGQLRRALRQMVLLADPDAARRRANKARDDARVEGWQETSGNAALSGRELPAAAMLAADARLTRIAKALKSAGAPGSLDQLRAGVFCALLAGDDPETLLPVPDSAVGDDGDAGPTARDDGDRGPAPASPATPVGSPSAGSPSGARPSLPPAALPGSGSAPGTVLGLGALAGSVHLTLPAATWLGWSDAPGEVPGYGPVDAWTARDLTARLAAHAAIRWHVTLTSPDGQAVAHACPRTGPPSGAGPPGRAGPAGAGARAGWLARLAFDWIETEPCTHSRATPAYRPGARLRELVTVRNRTCAAPGCRRPARQCDIDHTLAWHDGGLTCECNLNACCRRHHRAKQAPGWHAEQPSPGVMTWTTPHGRTYTSTPEPYLVA